MKERESPKTATEMPAIANAILLFGCKGKECFPLCS